MTQPAATTKYSVAPPLTLSEADSLAVSAFGGKSVPAATKSKLIAWMAGVENWAGETSTSQASLSKLSTTDLLQRYVTDLTLAGGSFTIAQGVPGQGPATSAQNGIDNAADAIDSVPEFLKWLTSGGTWVRFGEIAAGLILLAIGANAALKGTAAGNKISQATTVAKTIKDPVGQSVKKGWGTAAQASRIP